MTSERWARVESIYHAALERAPQQRADYVREACGDDEALRGEVESLLDHDHQAIDFLETPPALPQTTTHTASPALAKGQRMGAYVISERLGVGGMGEVYRAHDTVLGRQVAVKVLSQPFTTDAQRLERFEREARMLASLNHTHIAQIYGLEQSNGVRALVMELVEGPTLAELIARGPLSLARALAIASAIGLALEAAHDRGIVHRDLKPANIKFMSDGTLKVLDFGLAKAMAPSPHRDMVSSAPPALTEAGMILGTAAYMSPEQAVGEPVDKRSDLWAFGVIFFEMLTGRPVFDGDTISHLLAAVLAEQPQWGTLPANTPLPIRRLLRRCLEKERGRRLPDAADIRLELQEAAEPSPSTQPLSRPPRWLQASLLVITIIGAALVIILAMRTEGTSPPTPRLARLTIAPPPRWPLAPAGPYRDVAIAPDGSFIVYSAGTESQLVLRRIDRLEPSPLGAATEARQPIISPDGRWVAYVENGTTLAKVAVTGGRSATLARLPAHIAGMTWVDDSTIVLATDKVSAGLLRVPANGGDPTTLTVPDLEHGELGHWFPSALPGSRAVLFTIKAPQSTNTTIAVLDLETGKYSTVLRGGTDAQYVASGHLLYNSGGGLSVVRFDLQRRAVLGGPVPVPDEVGLAANGSMNATTSAAGTLVYVQGIPTGPPLQTLVWVDRQGREIPIGAPPRAYFKPRLSPDGTKVAVGIIADGDNSDLWLWDLRGQTLTPLTRHPASDLNPVWMPDGDAVVFVSTRAGPQNVFMRAADGTDTERRITLNANQQVPNSVTTDGRFIIGTEQRPASGNDIVRFAVHGKIGDGVATYSATEGLVDTASDEANGEVSPDGRFLAYQSNESGRSEIYVRPFPAVANGRWQISRSGGTMPLWTREGRELIFRDSAGRLTTSEIQITTATFRAGEPATLFSNPYSTPTLFRSYDAQPDGERFLMVKDVGAADAPPVRHLVVVENWTAELRQLLP